MASKTVIISVGPQYLEGEYEKKARERLSTRESSDTTIGDGIKLKESRLR